MKVKSLRAAALVAAGCLVLVGCSSSGNSGDSTTAKKKLAVVVANVSLNFASEMADGAKAAAEANGSVDFTEAGPATTDGPQEVQIFQNTVVNSPDGVVLENLAPDLFVNASADAIANGTPVIALDTIGLPGSNIETYVGNDNYDLGATLAKEALKRMGDNPSGVVVIGVPNPGVPVLDSRAKGIEDTFKAQAPNVKIKGPFQTFSDPGQSYNAWSSLVAANKDALAFLGVGDADSYSLAKIKTENGGDYLTAGFDLDDQTLQAVKDGVNFCTISPEHFLKGYVAMKMLADYAVDGTPIAKGWIDVPGLVVDSNNIDAIIKRQESYQGRVDAIAPQAEDIVANITDYTKPYGDAR